MHIMNNIFFGGNDGTNKWYERQQGQKWNEQILFLSTNKRRIGRFWRYNKWAFDFALRPLVYSNISYFYQ